MHYSAKLIISLFLIASSLLAVETLTDVQGRQIEVEILSISEEHVSIRRATDAAPFDILLTDLSTADRLALQNRAERSAVFKSAKEQAFDFKMMNALLELPLWEDEELWDDAPEKVLKRLGWPLESKTSTEESYRKYYMSKKDRIGSVRPYSATLYGQNGTVDYISIVFANKGDSIPFDLIDNPRKALRGVNRAIKEDSKALQEIFNTLGEPLRKSIGVGRGMKERVLRWDAGTCSFVLAEVKDEYLALRILPAHLADQHGRPVKMSTSKIKQRSKDNIIENDFGDVFVGNIPMVDQGPKGYCVPATLERYFRYMGIPADMYTLAMAGETEVSGTYVYKIIEGTRRYLRKAGRRIEEVRANTSVKGISNYIDKGQPLLWGMDSTPEYNMLCDAIARQRSKTSDVAEWKKTLRKLVRKSPKVRSNPDFAHLCLIIGYNKATNEIAVSDSWGPEYSIRWISEAEALNVSSSLYIVDF